jgi:hypothetical protein
MFHIYTNFFLLHIIFFHIEFICLYIWIFFTNIHIYLATISLTLYKYLHILYHLTCYSLHQHSRERCRVQQILVSRLFHFSSCERLFSQCCRYSMIAPNANNLIHSFLYSLSSSIYHLLGKSFLFDYELHACLCCIVVCLAVIYLFPSCQISSSSLILVLLLQIIQQTWYFISSMRKYISSSIHLNFRLCKLI